MPSDPVAAGDAQTDPAGEQAVTEQVVRRCGHHGNPLVYIEAPNPDGEPAGYGAPRPPWGWRCIHCFPQAFPGYRSEQRRLTEVQAVIRAMEAEVEARHAYSGDPDPRGTAMLEQWTKQLSDAAAKHRPTTTPAARQENES